MSATAKQVCSLARITYRQLDWWIRQGLITGPRVDGQGSGIPREFTLEEVARISRAAELVRVGLPPRSAFDIADRIAEHGQVCLGLVPARRPRTPGGEGLVSLTKSAADIKAAVEAAGGDAAILDEVASDESLAESDRVALRAMARGAETTEPRLCARCLRYDALPGSEFCGYHQATRGQRQAKDPDAARDDDLAEVSEHRPSDVALASLLARADLSTSKRVQARAVRIRALLAELRTAIETAEVEEHERAERKAAREAALANVRAAERALAEAREKARKARTATTPHRVTDDGRQKMRANGLRLAHSRGSHKSKPNSECPTCSEQAGGLADAC